jgi:hypothetical protein
MAKPLWYGQAPGRLQEAGGLLEQRGERPSAEVAHKALFELVENLNQGRQLPL